MCELMLQIEPVPVLRSSSYVRTQPWEWWELVRVGRWTLVQPHASASLILLLLDGLRKVLITEAPEGFSRSKPSKLNLEGEDGAIKCLKLSVWRLILTVAHWTHYALLVCILTLMAAAGKREKQQPNNSKMHNLTVWSMNLIIIW